jgi:hypothetical protein
MSIVRLCLLIKSFRIILSNLLFRMTSFEELSNINLQILPMISVRIYIEYVILDILKCLFGEVVEDEMDFNATSKYFLIEIFRRAQYFVYNLQTDPAKTETSFQVEYLLYYCDLYFSPWMTTDWFNLRLYLNYNI